LTDSRGLPLTPVPTPESKPANLASVYALSKYDQERMCLIVGRAYGLPTVALRFFNVYGPRQALSNPYTGVLAIFASQLLNDEAPTIFEDGYQQRDFVNVADIARACRLALEVPEAVDQVFNVASGDRVTVREISASISRVLGKGHIEPVISEQYRAGDIRHCFADTTLAERILGYRAQVSFEEGLAQLADWLEGRVTVTRAAEARTELAARGLTV
jgi:dTDP-L-rhamnose 4-epimerase